jgi:hypothetical protein
MFMSYVDQHLNSGEAVVHRTTLHPIIYLWGALLSLMALVLLFAPGAVGLGLTLLVPAALVLGVEWLRYTNSEFAVTTSRVIIKVGWISTHTLELQLAKVEALSVDQDLLGRVLDYGTLIVGGTGGTKEAFKYIKGPIAFRQAVQQQTELAARPDVRTPATLSVAPVAGARQERECPFLRGAHSSEGHSVSLLRTDGHASLGGAARVSGPEVVQVLCGWRAVADRRGAMRQAEEPHSVERPRTRTNSDFLFSF